MPFFGNQTYYMNKCNHEQKLTGIYNSTANIKSAGKDAIKPIIVM